MEVSQGSHALVLTLVFAAALFASLLVKFWLATRQMRHVAAHRNAVPSAFAPSISLSAHQRAADYTLAKGRFGLISMAVGAAILLGWTLLGGIDTLNVALRDALQPRFGALVYQLALLLCFALIGGLVDLPLELYATFVLEQRFGFNRMTWQLYLQDSLKELCVGAALGLPIAALVLWIMGTVGTSWWFWAWLAWSVFVLFVQLIFPIVVAPWFNKFEPLRDESLAERLRALMGRCGFSAKGLYVMDGGKRSAHSNAYFTGYGKSRRIVLFDTLLQRLSPPEMDAVLAHEIGHYKHKHVIKRIGMMFALSLAGFALLGWLSGQPWFYIGLGVQPSLTAPNDALALLLFLLAAPVFAFFVSPLFAQVSRKHEFEADAYACRQANVDDLAAALLKLHEDNASTLTPDPLYVRFYYSHPPASERLAALARHPTLQPS
jgi:STE24 endopeptidase